MARVKKTFMTARYNISLVGLKTKQYIHVQILVIKRSESWTKRIEGSCSTCLRTMKKRSEVRVVGVGVGFVTRRYVTRGNVVSKTG